MNIWLLLVIVIGVLSIGLVALIRWRSRDIEEVIRQGRPVLLRCGQDRIEGRSGGCSMCEPLDR